MSDVAKLRYSVDTRELVEARTELGRVRGAATGTQTALNGLGGSRASAQLDGTTRSATATGRALSGTGVQARDASGRLVTLEGNARATGRALDSAAQSGSRLMTALKGAALVVIGLGLGATVKSTLDYVDALTEVSTLVDTTSFDMAGLSEQARLQAQRFGTMPTENVGAFYQAISAGADTAEKATDLLTAANKLAIGGVTDTLTAVDGLTSSMNAYGEEAGTATDVSDAMFTAVKAGKTTIGELSANIGKLAPIAATAGVSLDEVLSATAALTKGGVATSTAMDGIRATIATVIKPSQEAAKAAERMGLDFSAAALESKGLAGFLEDVARKTGGSTDELALLFGGVEALTPVLALTGKASGDFATILGDMSDKAGATEEAFEKMANSPGFQMSRILATLSAGFIGLTESVTTGSVPALRAIADVLPSAFGAIQSVIDTLTTSYSDFMSVLSESDSWPFQALRDFGELVKKAGEYLAPVIPYMDDFGIALLGLGAGVAIIAALGAAFALLTSPITLTAAAITLVAVGVRKLYENWDSVVAWWDGIWDAIEKRASEFVEWFKGVPGRIVGAITSKAAQVKDAFLGLFDFMPSIADETVPIMERAGSDSAVGFINGAKSWLGGLFGVGDDMGGAVEDGLTTRMEIQSPSRLMARLGGYIGEGLADGIAGTQKQIAAAAQRISDELERSIGSMSQRIQSQYIELTEGAEAAERYELGLRGITGAAQDDIVAGNALITSLQEQKAMRDKLEGGIQQSIVNASSVREAFSNLGDFMEKWLKEKIATFAAQKIMVFLGMGDGGFTSGLGGILSSAGSVLSGFGTGLSGTLKTMGNSVSSFLGIASPYAGSMTAAQGATMGATTALGSFGASMGSVLSMAAPIAAMGVAANTLGKKFAEMTGLANEAGAGVGAMLAGPLGALIGGSMPSGWRTASAGVSVGVTDGEFEGENYEHLRARDLGGTKNIHRYSELDAQVEEAVSGFFANLNDTIVDQSSALGISGADSILDSFNMATEIFTGGTAEEDLQEWLEESTRAAYAQAFDNMSPELAAYMGDAVDIVNDSVEEISTTFERVAIGFTSVNDATLLLGLNFDKTAPSAVGASAALVELMGGLDQFQSATQSYYNEYYTLEERQKIALAEAAVEVEAFNSILNANGIQSITTRDQMMQLVEGLDLSTAAGASLWAQAMEVSGAFAAVADSGLVTHEIISQLPDGLKTSFGTMLDDTNNVAAALPVDLLASLDVIVVRSRVSGEEMQGNLLVSFDNMMAGAGLISTDLPQAMQAGYDDMLKRAAIAAAMLSPELEDALMDMVATTDAGGRDVVNQLNSAFRTAVELSETTGVDLNSALSTGFENVLIEAGVLRDNLPLEMQGAYDAVMGGAVLTSLSVIDSMDDMTGATGGLSAAAANATGDIGSFAGSIAAVGRSARAEFDKLMATAGATQSQRAAAAAAYLESREFLNANRAAVEAMGLSTSSTATAVNSNAAQDANIMRLMRENGLTFAQAKSQHLNGSHANGLGFVPFDGYRAELHKGEMVLPASISEQIRSLGPGNSRVSSNAPKFSAPITNLNQQNNNGLKDEIVALRKEVGMLRKENNAGLSGIGQSNAAIVSGTEQQTAAISKSERSNEQLTREIRKAIA